MRNLLSGCNARLTAIKDEDLASLEEWFGNTAFLRCYDIVPAVPKTQKEVKELLAYYSDTDERHIFAIRPKELNNIVGIAGFDEIIWSSGVATAFIGIGDSQYVGKGLGKEAMTLLLDFGFHELNFYRIQLDVISYNEPAIGLYESLGFVREGTYRSFIFRDGERFDLYLYGLLKEEWKRIRHIP